MTHSLQDWMRSTLFQDCHHRISIINIWKPPVFRDCSLHLCYTGSTFFLFWAIISHLLWLRGSSLNPHFDGNLSNVQRQLLQPLWILSSVELILVINLLKSGAYRCGLQIRTKINSCKFMSHDQNNKKKEKDTKIENTQYTVWRESQMLHLLGPFSGHHLTGHS